MEKELKKLLYSYNTLSAHERRALMEDIGKLYKVNRASIIAQTVMLTLFTVVMLRIIFGPI
jgi:hypothetical protein